MSDEFESFMSLSRRYLLSHGAEYDHRDHHEPTDQKTVQVNDPSVSDQDVFVSSH